MSRLDEPVDPATVYEVAGRVLDHHDKGGTCQACTHDDCPQTVWALAEVAAHHGRRTVGSAVTVLAAVPPSTDPPAPKGRSMSDLATCDSALMPLGDGPIDPCTLRSGHDGPCISKAGYRFDAPRPDDEYGD